MSIGGDALMKSKGMSIPEVKVTGALRQDRGGCGREGLLKASGKLGC